MGTNITSKYPWAQTLHLNIHGHKHYI